MDDETVWTRSVYRGSSTPRDRVVASVLSLAIMALVAIVIIRMGYLGLQPSKLIERLTAITLTDAGSSSKGKAQENKKPMASTPLDVPPPITPVPPPKLVIPNPKAPPATFTPLSSSDMAAADISKLGKSGSGASTGNSSAAYGPGEGPQGQMLYKAEWYREPSRAELAGYLTEQSAGAKWAEIACRTAEHYRVDNCQSLGESPPGSGLARALRQASWQFLVRPPRIDGKPQIGAWVRIHFDFVRGEAK